MNHQFLQKSEVAAWKKREDLLSKTRQNAIQLFGEGWNENSVWELSKHFVLQMQKNSQGDKIGEKQKSFFNAMAEQVDYDLLENINRYLERLLKVSPVSLTATLQSSTAITEEWSALGDFLDLSSAGTEKLWDRVKGSPGSELTKLMEEIRPLANSYNDFRINFIFVASALICYIPPNPVMDLDSFKYVLSVEAEKDKASFNIENGLVVVNFLGWSLVSENVETMQWATEYLTKQFEPDNAIFSSSADTLLFVVILHLAFFNLTNQPREIQEELVKKFVWKALCFGAPAENILREVLLKKDVLKNQEKYYDVLAEILVASNENIYLISGKQSMMTVGQFIKRFLAFSRGDHGGFSQVKYIGELLKEYGWPEGLRYHLFALLNLYLHLKTGEIFAEKRIDNLLKT